ncbi:MAG: acyl--CoA ligase [Kofleriaceae bacterium]|nr:MAG: acyl--CoA ligase [Kofleriaceae bacterium]MBZ0232843.1 acyl--CoA ligase [Kofleriaceae bacterium]
MLWDALAGSSFATSSRDAVVSDQATLSYAELFANADALARVLGDAGAGPGHVVLAYLDNVPGFLVALLAAARLGAAFAPLDIGVTDAEARGLIELSRSDLVVCDPSTAARVATWSRNLVTVTPRGEVVEPRLAGLAPPSVDPATGIMQFSSGTTGASKGILLGHEALYCRSHYLSRALGLGASDRTLCTLPLSHTHGAECLALPTLMTGGTLFLKSPRFAFPLYILEELERLRITFFSAIPQFYDVAVKLSLPRTLDLSALRLPFCGSAALARATAEAFHATYGVHIRQGYGLAELSVICVNMHEGGRVVYDSVGKVLDGIEWRVTDDGELLVRSKAMFTGYINGEAATRERLRDGWLHTGDVVAVDDDGMFRIVGRKEDFIKVNGFKVYASEVETAIIAVDWIAECAVTAERDDVGSESIVAHVVVREERVPAAVHDQLVRQLRTVLSEHKLPRRTVVWPELPKSPLGKILKSQIRQPRK